jgi:hypothetical protein
MLVAQAAAAVKKKQQCAKEQQTEGSAKGQTCWG